MDGRCYKIDNIKAILIVLVIIGHFYKVVSFPSSLFQCLLIYSFHMPAFSFISGICFKPISNNKVFKNILYPYVVFQTLILICNAYCSEGTLAGLELQYTTPYWALWYLLSLFIWYLIMNAITFKKIGGAVILTLCFMIAILAGFEKTVGYYLSCSRTIAYFPFFLGGGVRKKIFL